MAGQGSGSLQDLKTSFSRGRYVSHVTRWLFMGSVVSVGAVVVLSLAEAIGRYLLHRPIPGVIEVQGTLMVLIVCAGMAEAQRQRNHVKVDIAWARLSEKVQQRLELLTLTVYLLVVLFLTVASSLVAYQSTLVKEYAWTEIRYPLWAIRWLIVVGFLVISAELAIELKQHLLSLRPHWTLLRGTRN